MLNLLKKYVKTYLNRGNVIFSSDEDDIKKFTIKIETAMKNQFSFIKTFSDFIKLGTLGQM